MLFDPSIGAPPAMQVRTAADLAELDALLIPGGESTTMALVAERSGLLQPLRDWIAGGRPVWVRTCANARTRTTETLTAADTRTDRRETARQGTCAGMIMISKEARHARDGQALLGALDVKVNRNHFGSQARRVCA